MSEQHPSEPQRPARERVGDLSWTTDLTESGDVAGFGFTFGEAEGDGELLENELDQELDPEELEQD